MKIVQHWMDRPYLWVRQATGECRFKLKENDILIVVSRHTYLSCTEDIDHRLVVLGSDQILQYSKIINSEVHSRSEIQKIMTPFAE